MPAPVIDLKRNFYLYTSDNTIQFTVATLNANNAAQTSPQTPIDPSLHPAYDRGFVMRKVHGKAVVSGVTYTTKIPVFDPTDDIWVGASTSTFTKWGTTYNIAGRIGERRIYRS